MKFWGPNLVENIVGVICLTFLIGEVLGIICLAWMSLLY